MDALSGERIEEHGKRRHEGLAFTGGHLRDLALMQDDTADQLYPVMFHMKNTSGRFADCRKGIRQNVIQRFSICKAFPELLCPGAKRFIRQGHHFIAHAFNSIHNGINTL